MKVSTMMFPERAERISPITGKLEIYDTGKLVEMGRNADGKLVPIGQPVVKPVYTADQWTQAERARRAGQLDVKRTQSFTINRSAPTPASHFARNSETNEQAADRMAATADRGNVSIGAGYGRVTFSSSNGPGHDAG